MLSVTMSVLHMSRGSGLARGNYVMCTISVYFNFFAWSDIVSDQASVWSDMIDRLYTLYQHLPPLTNMTYKLTIVYGSLVQGVTTVI